MPDKQAPVKDYLGADSIAEEIDFETLSSDRRLNKLLKSVLGEVKIYAENQIKHIKQLTQIGLALSSEKDISKLLEVLTCLVDAGNTVVVIEHHMDVIKSADYVVDLGPEGGDEGGYVIGVGTPEELSQNTASHTGRFLKKFLSSQTGNNIT